MRIAIGLLAEKKNAQTLYISGIHPFPNWAFAAVCTGKYIRMLPPYRKNI